MSGTFKLAGLGAIAFFIVLCLSASGCAQERTAPGAIAPGAVKSVEESAPVQLEPSTPIAAVRESSSAPPPPEENFISPFTPLDASCAVDSDCEVKDVGNCCGRMPACVNRAAKPFDAAAMQRECERTGTSSICGFQELSGCLCQAGRCVGVPSNSGGGDVR